MIIGHQRIVDFLYSSVATNRLAHAYLFVGPPEVGKKMVAVEFAKHLQCQNIKAKPKEHFFCGECVSCLSIEKQSHPDVLFVEPVDSDDPDKARKNREIKIDQIRKVQHQIILSPFSSQYKIVVIDPADKMSQEAASCLLKTLEEPPQKSIMILISSSWYGLLPTIISRCQLIKFLPVKNNIIAEGLKNLGLKNKSKIEEAVRISNGRPGRAIKLLSDTGIWEQGIKAIEDLKKISGKDLTKKFQYVQKLSQDSLGAQDVLGWWIIWLRDQILSLFGLSRLAIFKEESTIKKEVEPVKIKEMIKDIEKATELLGENGFNARLILENLMLKI